MEWEQRVPPRGPGGRLPPFGDLKAQRQLSKVSLVAFTEGETKWQGRTPQQPAGLGSCGTAAQKARRPLGGGSGQREDASRAALWEL